MRAVLSEMARILQAAVNREPVTVARRVAVLSVFWDTGIQEAPYRRLSGFVLWDRDEYQGWAMGAKRVLSRLLVEHGHQLKECSAQTLLREWAYVIPYASSAQRTAALTRWLNYYNWHRPHSALNYQPPISRAVPPDDLLRLHI